MPKIPLDQYTKWVLDRDPSTVNDAAATYTVGAIYHYGGKMYVYAEAEDLAWADGSVCCWADTACTEASPDRAGGTAINAAPAGVAVGTVTEGNYGFLLIQGFHDAVKTDGAVGSAGPIMVDVNNDHEAVELQDELTSAGADTGSKRIGFALSADTSAATVPAWISI